MMFKRVPGPVAYTGGDRLGLWEFKSENGATEMLHKRENEDCYNGPAAKASDTFRRISPNNARQIDNEK